MAQSFRKSQILDIARSDGRVVVEDLAERFGVSTQTIRRDLTDLAADGKLDRVHGGAIMPAGALNIRYADRQAINETAKAAIAAACAADIPNNSSVLLNIGTSTEAVARALMGHQNLTVLTNNMNVANILSANDTFQIIVLGGMMRAQDGGLVGDLTVQAIDRFKVDHAVIGTSALDLDGDLLDFDLQEVRVSRTIIMRSKRTSLVVDASKLERSAPVRIASLCDLDAVYTDWLPPSLMAKCTEGSTLVRIAD
ncbi:MAG: DeoR/GlpR family DNA-binding transcription regulator [Pseudomonadota bacterium]